MKLTDILPVEQWVQLENEIYERSGLNPSIYDADGVNITGTATKNDLCRTIKSNPNGLNIICASSTRTITDEAKRTFQPVVGVCRSGQAKIVVPIVVGVTYVGAASGCGLVPEDGDVDSLSVGRTLGMEHEKVEELARRIPRISGKTAKDVANYIKDRIDGIISIFMVMQNEKTNMI